MSKLREEDFEGPAPFFDYAFTPADVDEDHPLMDEFWAARLEHARILNELYWEEEE